VEYTTKFGSLADYQKGTVEIIDDDARRYVFSNIFEVASAARPYEKVAVARNMEYVLEAIRAEGTSGWRTCAHDEFALVLDGTVEIRLVKLDQPVAAADQEGSVAIEGEPSGARMGRIVGSRGHMALLPANAAYQFHADSPSVILLQTIIGEGTVERWAEICLS
jgi:hypothetical protein